MISYGLTAQYINSESQGDELFDVLTTVHVAIELCGNELKKQFIDLFRSVLL